MRREEEGGGCGGERAREREDEAGREKVRREGVEVEVVWPATIGGKKRRWK